MLREVQVIVRDNTECKQLYSEQPNIVDERVLCAGDNGKDSCQVQIIDLIFLPNNFVILAIYLLYLMIFRVIREVL